MSAHVFVVRADRLFGPRYVPAIERHRVAGSKLVGVVASPRSGDRVADGAFPTGAPA